MMLKKESRLSDTLVIPRIITGLWQVADMERNGTKLDPQETAKFMDAYAQQGFNTFDMADHYGSSEEISGVYSSNFPLGAEANLFTKWVPKPGKISLHDVEQAVDLAHSRMRNRTIDLLQFHAWQYSDPSWLDGMFYLSEVMQKKQFSHLGVTNFDHAHLRVACASGIPVVSNQICYSLLDQRADGPMSELCRDFDVKILAFGTLAGGFLTDKWLGKEEPLDADLKTWSQMKYKRFIDVAGGWEVFQNLLEKTRMVADKHSVSIANIATRFVLENEAVAAVIIGARLGERNHIEENKKILDIDFDQKDIDLIKEAQSKLKPIPGNCGDEYRKPPFLTASGDLSHHLDQFPPEYEVQSFGKGRAKIFSGTPWEDMAGYCRAVKAGNHIHVSGTTATHGSRLIGGLDPAAQTHFIIDKIEGVLNSFGSSLADVVRTRIFVKNISDWEPVALAHGQRFKDIRPANTLVEANLVGDSYLVEIEAEAEISN